MLGRVGALKERPGSYEFVLGDLTPREVEVVELMSRGMSNPAIGAQLGIGLETAKWHVANIISKAGVQSRVEAADVWERWNRPTARLSRRLRAVLGVPLLLKAGAAAAVGGAAAAGAIAVGSVGWPGGIGTDASPESQEAIVARVVAPDGMLNLIGRVDGPSSCLWLSPPGGAWRAGACSDTALEPVFIGSYPWGQLGDAVVLYGWVSPRVETLIVIPADGQSLNVELNDAGLALDTDSRFFALDVRDPSDEVTIRALDGAGAVIHSEKFRLQARLK